MSQGRAYAALCLGAARQATGGALDWSGGRIGSATGAGAEDRQKAFYAEHTPRWLCQSAMRRGKRMQHGLRRALKGKRPADTL